MKQRSKEPCKPKRRYQEVSLSSLFSDADPKTVGKALEHYFRHCGAGPEYPTHLVLSLTGAVIEHGIPTPMDSLIIYKNYFRNNLKATAEENGNKHLYELNKAFGKAVSAQEIKDLLAQQAYTQALLPGDLNTCTLLNRNLEIACRHIEVVPFEMLPILCGAVASQVDPGLTATILVE